MSTWNCQVDDTDSLAVFDEGEGVDFDIVERWHRNTVRLSYGDAMQVAAEIVRLVHGERTPRVWETADEVPDGVIVKSEHFRAVRYGPMWLYGEVLQDGTTDWEPWNRNSHSPEEYAHFTEVI